MIENKQNIIEINKIYNIIRKFAKIRKGDGIYDKFFVFVLHIIFYRYVCNEINIWALNYFANEYNNLTYNEVENLKFEFGNEIGFYIPQEYMIDNIKFNKDEDLHKKLCNIFTKIIKCNEQENRFLANFFVDFLHNENDFDAGKNINNTIYELLNFFTNNDKFDFKNDQQLLKDLFNTYYIGTLSNENAVCNSLAYLMTSLLAVNKPDKNHNNYYNICDIHLTDSNIFVVMNKLLAQYNYNLKFIGETPLNGFLSSARYMHLYINGISINNIEINNYDKNDPHFVKNPDCLNKKFYNKTEYSKQVANNNLNTLNKLLKFNRHYDKSFDFIISCLPISSRGWNDDSEFIYIQYCIEKLNKNGTAVVLCSAESFMRKNEIFARIDLLKSNCIDAIIALPNNLYNERKNNLYLLVLKKNKPNTNIVFLDAKGLFKRGYNNYIFSFSSFNDLTIEHIKTISKAYYDRVNVTNFVTIVDKEKLIKELQFNLSVENFVDKKQILSETENYNVNDEIKKIELNLIDLSKQQNAIYADLDIYKLQYSDSCIDIHKSFIFQRLYNIIKVQNRNIIELSNYVDIKYGLLTPSNEQDIINANKDNFLMVKIRDVANAKFSMNYSKLNNVNNPPYATNFIAKNGIFKAGSILIPRHGYRMQQNYRLRISVPAYIDSHCIVVTSKSEERLNSYLLYNFLLTFDANKCKTQTQKESSVPKISKNDVANIKIPIFSSQEQQQITEFLYTLNKLNDNYKQVLTLKLEYLKNNFLLHQKKYFEPIFLDKDNISYETIKIKNLNSYKSKKFIDFSFHRGTFPENKRPTYNGENGKPFIQNADIPKNTLYLTNAIYINNKISPEEIKEKSYMAKTGSILFTLQGQGKKISISTYDCYVDRSIGVIYYQNNNILDKEYFVYYLYYEFAKIQSKQFGTLEHNKGNSISTISELQIPIIEDINLQKQYAKKLQQLEKQYLEFSTYYETEIDKQQNLIKQSAEIIFNTDI